MAAGVSSTFLSRLPFQVGSRKDRRRAERVCVHSVRIGKPKKKRSKRLTAQEEAAAAKAEARAGVLRRIRQGQLSDLHRTFTAHARQVNEEYSQCEREMASGDTSGVPPTAPSTLVAAFRVAFVAMDVRWASSQAVAGLFSDHVIFRGAFSDTEVRGKAAVLEALNDGERFAWRWVV
jgi:hypothetical protein